MTWYASQLIADSVTSLVEELRTHPLFGRGLFHVPDPADRGLRLPAKGLLFVRELCLDAPEDDHAREWFGEDALVGSISSEGPELEIDRARVKEHLPHADPSLALLREAKRMSRAHRASITYFETFFWGGDQEYAAAWVFDAIGEEAVYTYSHERDRRGHGDDFWAWRITAHGSRPIVQGDVLSLALIHHGMMTCHRFTPHERSFPWDRHRVR